MQDLNMKDLIKFRSIQNIAREVLEEVPYYITSESTETSISEKCIDLLASKGVTETWYYNTIAFVLLGSRSTLSISGKDYTPSLEKVGSNNLITIDLSPIKSGIWGDCARSFVFHNGKIETSNYPEEYRLGIQVERDLHRALTTWVDRDTTFEDLYFHMNNLIKERGFINLDFQGNLGHSICRDMNKRVYIEEGNRNKLSSVNLFTFEPHITDSRRKWGFKHEEIYYFDSSNKLQLL